MRDILRVASLAYEQAREDTAGLSEYGTGAEYERCATETFERAECAEELGLLSWAVLVQKNLCQVLLATDPGRLYDAMIRHVGYCLVWAELAKAAHDAKRARK